jgi:hypothetical protein
MVAALNGNKNNVARATSDRKHHWLAARTDRDDGVERVWMWISEHSSLSFPASSRIRLSPYRQSQRMEYGVSIEQRSLQSGMTASDK